MIQEVSTRPRFLRFGSATSIADTITVYGCVARRVAASSIQFATRQVRVDVENQPEPTGSFSFC